MDEHYVVLVLDGMAALIALVALCSPCWSACTAAATAEAKEAAERLRGRERRRRLSTYGADIPEPPFANIGAASKAAARRRRLWRFSTVTPVAVCILGATAALSLAVEVLAAPPAKDAVLVHLTTWLEAGTWLVSTAAVWVRIVSFAPGSCALPLSWLFMLATHVYALGSDLRPGDMLSATSSRAEAMEWCAFACSAAAVLFAWCCCTVDAGVHEPLEMPKSRDLVDATAPLLGGGAAPAAPRSASQAGSSAPLAVVAAGGGGGGGSVGAAARGVARAGTFTSKVQAGLEPREVAKFYDGFGIMQDYERLYTDHATSSLRAMARLGGASRVLEFGCGTGALGRKMLESDLADSARYIGIDISETMVEITRKRLRPWGPRAEVRHSDGSPDLGDIEDGSIDRIVTTYVFDAISDDYLARLLPAMARVLSPEGRLCIASLTFGNTPFASSITAMWVGMYKCAPSWLGGCRPLEVAALLRAHGWVVEQRKTITQLALTSEVVIAVPPAVATVDVGDGADGGEHEVKIE